MRCNRHRLQARKLQEDTRKKTFHHEGGQIWEEAAKSLSPEIFKPWLDSDLGHLLYSDQLAVGGRNT